MIWGLHMKNIKRNERYQMNAIALTQIYNRLRIKGQTLQSKNRIRNREKKKLDNTEFAVNVEK